MTELIERVARAVCKAFAMDYHGLCEIDANFETDKEWENWIPEAKAAIAAMQADADIERIKRERDQAVEALRFYARENSWRSCGMYMSGRPNPSSAEIDKGNKARTTLASIEGTGHE